MDEVVHCVPLHLINKILYFIHHIKKINIKFLIHLLTIVSSIGYVVLSGKIHVDRQDTTLTTLYS